MKLKMYYPAVIEVIGKMLKLLEIQKQTTFVFGKSGKVPTYIRICVHCALAFYPKRVVEGGLIQSKCAVEHLRVLLKRLSRTHKLLPPGTESQPKYSSCTATGCGL